MTDKIDDNAVYHAITVTAHALAQARAAMENLHRLYVEQAQTAALAEADLMHLTASAMALHPEWFASSPARRRSPHRRKRQQA